MANNRHRLSKAQRDVKNRQRLTRKQLEHWFAVDIWIDFSQPNNVKLQPPKANMDDQQFRPLRKDTMSEYELYLWFRGSDYKEPDDYLDNEIMFAIDDSQQRHSHRIYWDLSYIFKVLWRAQSLPCLPPADKTYVGITFKRFLQNPWGSRQGKTLGFMGFALGYDWAQASQIFKINFKQLVNVNLNKLPKTGIYIWYFIADSWYDIRILLRILFRTLILFCPPPLRPKWSRRFKPSSRRAKQVALPRFLRRVGGPTGLIQALVPIFVPWAFLQAMRMHTDWATQRIQQSPLETILHKEASDGSPVLMPSLGYPSPIQVETIKVNQILAPSSSEKKLAIFIARFIQIVPTYPYKIVKKLIDWAPSVWIAIEPKLLFCLSYTLGPQRALKVEGVVKNWCIIAAQFMVPRYQTGTYKLKQVLHGIYRRLIKTVVQSWILLETWSRIFFDQPAIHQLRLWLPISDERTLVQKIWERIEYASDAHTQTILDSTVSPAKLPVSIVLKEQPKEMVAKTPSDPVDDLELTEEDEEDFEYALQAVSTLYPGWENEGILLGDTLNKAEEVSKASRVVLKKKLDFQFGFDRKEAWCAVKDQLLLVYDAWLRSYGRFSLTPSWRQPTSYVFDYVERFLNEFNLDTLASWGDSMYLSRYDALIKQQRVHIKAAKKLWHQLLAHDAMSGVKSGLGLNTWTRWGNGALLVGLMALWIGMCSFSLNIYLDIWDMWKEGQKNLYPTRFRQIRYQIELELLAEYQQEYTFFPTWMPELRSRMFERYMRWYRWHMKKRVIPKYFKGSASRADKLRIHRTLVEKNLITSNALLQPTSTSLKQKLGQSEYEDNFIDDSTLSSLYHMITQHSSGLPYLLTFMSLRHFPWSVLYYKLYTPALGRPERLADSIVQPERTYYNGDSWPHRAYLLVGKKHSGKTYFVKNVAINTYLPLVYIDTKRLYLTRRELEMELRFYNDTGMRPLLEGIEIENKIGEKYLKARILFRLAERVAPCIVWIPTVQRYTSDWYRNAPVWGTYEMILVAIIEMMERNVGKWGKRQMLIFAGCENTRYLDPLYLKPDRFTQLIRIEIPSSKDREGRLLGLLQTQGMVLRDGFDFTTIRNITMGYSMWNIAGAVTAVNRMCFNLRSNVVDEILLSDALEVHHTGLNYDNNAPFYTSSSNFAAYKVGQAVIKRMIFPQPLYHDRNRFWLFHFYYLSRWYLEIRDTDFTLTSSLTLPYLFASLAGIATHDAWMSLYGFSLGFDEAVWDEICSDDVQTANTIARAYVSEIHMLYTKNLDSNGKIRFSPRLQWSTGTLLNVLRVIDLRKAGNLDADAYIIQNYNLPQYRHDEPEQFYESHFTEAGLYDRVAMYRSFMYDTESHLANSPSLFTLGRYGYPPQMMGRFRKILTNEEYWRPPVLNYNQEKSLDTPDVQLLFDYGHERQLFYRYRARHMTWNVHYDNLEYLTEHRNAPGSFLISRRTIWNPKPLVPLHLDFFDRELLIDRLVMSYLYTVYVDRPDPSKLIKIRKPFWFRDEAQERIERIIQEMLRIAKEGGEDKETTAEKKERKLTEAQKEIYKPFPLFRKILRPNRQLLWPRMYKKRQHRMVDQFFADFPLETLSRYEVLIDEQLYDSNKRIDLESFMNRQLANIYNTIYRWALKHQVMLYELVKLLWQQGVLWPKQLDTFGTPDGLDKLATFQPPERIYQKYLNNQSMPVRIWFWKSIRSLFAGAGDPSNVVPRHPKAFEILDYQKFIEAETRFLLYFKNLKKADDTEQLLNFTYDYEDL